MEKLYFKVLKIIKKSAKIYYKQAFEESVESYKYETDDVTNKDIETQKYLVKEFLKLIPNSGFLAEEKLNETKDKEYVWVIDPIDGTYNYKNFIELYGTQVALRKNGKVVFCAMHIPALNQMYYSYAGKSYCNGKQIFSSEKESAQGVVFNFHLLKNQEKFLEPDILYDFLKTKKVRIYGSSLFDFTLLASGKIDCLIINATTAWDLEPGMFLAANAGAKSLKVEKIGFYLVAGNNKILNDVEKKLRLIEADYTALKKGVKKQPEKQSKKVK